MVLFAQKALNTHFPAIVEAYSGDVHNFTPGCLVAYAYLDTVLSSTHSLNVTKDFISFVVRGRRKTFVYAPKFRKIKQLQSFQKEGVIYSLNRIPLQKEKKFIEILHELPIIFNRDSYSSAKKWNKKITNPLNWAKINLTCSSITKSNFEEINVLHTDWVNHKLNQESTFKMMFPKKRYIRCCDIAYRNIIDGMTSFIFTYQSKIVAVKVFYIKNATAFLLASFGNTWGMKSQIMNITNVYSFYLLYESGITKVNTGSITDKNAKIFKQHLPFKECISYMYSQIKE